MEVCLLAPSPRRLRRRTRGVLPHTEPSLGALLGTTLYVLLLVRVSGETTDRRCGQRAQLYGTGSGDSGAASPKSTGWAGRLGAR